MAAAADALRVALAPWRALRKSAAALAAELGASPVLLAAAPSFEAALGVGAAFDLLNFVWGDEGQHGGASGYEAFRSPEGLYDALGLALAVGYVRLGRPSAGAPCPVPAAVVAMLLASMPRVMPAGGEAELRVAEYRGYLARLALHHPATWAFFLARADAAAAPPGGMAPPNARTGGLLGLAECVAAAGNLQIVQGQWSAGWQQADLNSACAQVQAVGVDEGVLKSLANALAQQAEEAVVNPGPAADATATANARRAALYAGCVAAQASEAAPHKEHLAAVNAQLVDQAQVSATLQASAIDAWAALSDLSQRLQRGQKKEARVDNGTVGQRGAGQLRWYHRFAWERISLMAGNRAMTAAVKAEGTPGVSCVVQEVGEEEEEEAALVMEGAVLVLAPQPAAAVGTAALEAAAPLLASVAASGEAESEAAAGEAAAAVRVTAVPLPTAPEAAAAVAAVSEEIAVEEDIGGLLEAAAPAVSSGQSNGKRKHRLLRFGLAVTAAVAGALLRGARR